MPSERMGRKIAPAILAADFAPLGEQVVEVAQARAELINRLSRGCDLEFDLTPIPPYPRVLAVPSAID